ncbi:thiolase family protein [Stella sp.]|uniref:thiolase family protein n=1 Tax=Stella sp. TaxID=2912054 RepID=UPI0035AE7946
MAHIAGAGDTGFGRHEGRTTIDLMTEAATVALADAGLARGDIDGLVCGYSTTHPHLMLATVFAEHFGLEPVYAHAVQAGGATGCAMTMLAARLVDAGQCRRILVVGAENRATGQSRDSAIQTLAQVGHPDFEVPYGATIPAYYALLASRYLHVHGLTEADLAEFAVLMRRHAANCPGAHQSAPITVADVLASKPIARPLKLLDCCPISDGGVALVVQRDEGAARIAGMGQAHRHQHISHAADLTVTGAGEAAGRAFAEAGCRRDDVDFLAVYDSFTITLTMLLEEIGFAPRGGAAGMARDGSFGPDGRLPLNTHGGLLAFGHCGVGGGMAHVAEAYRQLAGKAGARQVAGRRTAFVHGDGGVMSSHVSLVLRAA